MSNQSPERVALRILGAVLFLAFALFAAPPVYGQAPPLPDDINQDSRLTWHPTLNPTAAVTVDSLDVVTDWRGGAPKVVPTKGREPLIVAIEQLSNNSGEWVGVTGRHGAVKLGNKIDRDESARPSGFQGISVIGLDTDSSSSDGAVIAGFALAQYVGVNRDFAFINLTIDSWTNRPCTTAANANPTFGHLYEENIEFLSICNDLARPLADGSFPTAKGDASTTWIERLEGHVQTHFKNVRMVGGVAKGDGKDGTSEHGVYQNGPPGDSEFIDTYWHGCQISALYFPTRFADRIEDSKGNPIAERFGHGKLLIINPVIRDCGVNGSFAINICGGILDPEIWNPDYRVNLDGYSLSGQKPGGKWAGSFLQVYLDHKAFYLLPPINSNSKPVALGYSLETGTTLPMSPGIQALVDAGVLPWDGRGGARSLKVYGGTYRCANLTNALFNLRDVAAMPEFYEGAVGVAPFSVQGAGKTIAFGSTGVGSQCGPGGAGQNPDAVWGQQCRFFTRKPATSVFGKVMVGGNQISSAQMDGWRARP